MLVGEAQPFDALATRLLYSTEMEDTSRVTLTITYGRAPEM